MTAELQKAVEMLFKLATGAWNRRYDEEFVSDKQLKKTYIYRYSKVVAVKTKEHSRQKTKT